MRRVLSCYGDPLLILSPFPLCSPQTRELCQDSPQYSHHRKGFSTSFLFKSVQRIRFAHARWQCRVLRILDNNCLFDKCICLLVASELDAPLVEVIYIEKERIQQTTRGILNHYSPWHVAHSEASLGWGGQERRILTELIGFQRRRSKVAMLTPAHSQLSERVRESGVPVFPINVHRLRLPFEMIRLSLWLKRNKIQILNTHSSRDGYLVGMAGRLAGTPLLIRSRHIDVEYPNPRVSRHAFTTFADHILTTSQKITNHLRSTFNLSSENITTLPTGIDLSLYNPHGQQADLGNTKTEPCVGMVSVLRSWKGHSVFIEAARLLRERRVSSRFMIVGGGPQQSNIEKLIDESRLAGQVTLAGHREDIPEVLRALDVLVIPSTKHEGIPQIGLQAMACGTPVVGSDVGGIPEIIQPGKTGRITRAGDGEQLANAIAEALTNTEATSRMADHGRMMVEREHGIERMLDQLDSLYLRLINFNRG